MKAAKYVVLYLIVLQFLIPYLVPNDKVYHNRMDYPLTALKESNNIDPVLAYIKREIDANPQDDYIIMLGDSVFYGSPGNSDQSPNVFMEERAQADPNSTIKRVYNLALPANQLGDLYAMLLKLDQYEISTDNLIFNIRYPSFMPREGWPPTVFWMQKQLRARDSDTFEHVSAQLKATKYELPQSWYDHYKFFIYEEIMQRIPMFQYKDYLQKAWEHTKLHVQGKPIPDDSLGDPMPWYTKGHLWEYMENDEIVNSYTDKPFDFSETSLDVYFLEQILKHQQGKNTVVVMTGVNQELMQDFVSKPGYQENMKQIDRLFEGREVRYINLEGVLDDDLFSDHTHFTPEGYEALGNLLWDTYINR
ncbi:SGNH/GDSL hydrolase family protein [Paenibacillus senegalensis]|uniref:SGNH/GDSL hydrolase family protein n=1 Tax=Paenibacillus senegalensis TaxID=1465766 RepID=UPI000289685B|nr:SGNH/GDSL hydrolase family protein [Paenibacillus senegalensis]